MDMVWFGAQCSSRSYFCKGIGLLRHHGAFLSLSSRFFDLWENSLSQEKIIFRVQEGSPSLFSGVSGSCGYFQVGAELCDELGLWLLR